MKIRNRVVSAVLIVALAAFMGEASANAADTQYPTSETWKVSYVNIQGAPSSESKSATVTIRQKEKGATANCTGCENVYDTSASGTTSFYCSNYQMTPQSITNLGSASLEPDSGHPTDYINVTYQVYAYTSVRPNVYWSWGDITSKQ